MNDKVSALMTSRMVDFTSRIPYLLVMSDQFWKWLALVFLGGGHMTAFLQREAYYTEAHNNNPKL